MSLRQYVDEIAMRLARALGSLIAIVFVVIPLGIMMFFRHLFSGDMWKDLMRR